MFEAARWKRCGLVMKFGSLSWMKPRALSASWKYVVRELTNATFFPLTVPRA